MRGSQLVLLLALAALSCATPENKWSSTMRRQLPKAPTGVKSIKTPNNVTIRYKEPGTEGVCETTPGVKSYSGYVDLSPESHTFFWFFESRRDPENDPVTLWLNGGPGSDSLIGLFEELGPCHITPEYESIINQYSWNEVTNLLFLSQPLGVGFSYSETEAGSLNPITGVTENVSFAGVQGRYPVIDATIIDTTDIAARATWEVLQGFLGGLSQLDSEVKSKEFNLWTESYGGHYGPAANYYPEFAVNNTYGIKALNDTVYNYMKFANTMPNGCQDQVSLCKLTNRTSLADYAICTEAANMCRDNVEGPYYQFGGRGVYDIRHPYNDPTPPSYFVDYLNKDSVMDAIGVDINYTESSSDVYYAFQQTGDFVWPNFIEDLEEILRLPVRVSLIYGDADYICNWFGGQAISLAVNYTHASQFRAAGYTPMTVDGVEYGETREYGNFSFTRVYQAGHEVPYYQPIAALQLFNRTLFGWDIAAGTTQIWPDYTTNGTAQATHTQSFVPLSTASSTTVD
ncbi:hypothetical protein AtubIFM56815_011114 [Aspergillus tubingensis]|uniref:Carboxypeptidase n=1 Tax=Aspergillus tubingensis TaxID=5068 RepID=A0A9W6ARV2_ASPTU|nr:hypothetical protein AtubIFM56815_011114 [Aspergillus tubingensis]